MTKEKFLAYEKVRRSGKVNMFDVSTVMGLSGGVLDKEDCLDIMKNYSNYKYKYL